MAESGWLRIYFSENAYATVPASMSTTAKGLCETLHRKRRLQDALHDSPDNHALFLLTETGGANDHLFERRLEPSERPLEVQENLRKQGHLDHFKLWFRPLDAKGRIASSLDAVAADAGHHPDDEEGAEGQGSGDEEEPFGSGGGMPAAGVNPSASFRVIPGSRTMLGANAAGNASVTVVQPLSHSAQAMAADPAIVRAGYLEKRGKRNTAWKERWFVLRGPCAAAPHAVPALIYYKSHLPQPPLATIPLSEAFVRPVHSTCMGLSLLPFVAAPSVTNLSLSPALPVPHAHSSATKCSTEFEVDTVPRIYSMRARSYPEMQQWLFALQSVLPIDMANAELDEAQAMIEAIELAESAREAKRLAHVTTLQGLLSDAITIEELVKFETDNRREENVLFWLETDAFHAQCAAGNKKKAQLLERAQAIYKNFLQAGAPQEVHVADEEERSLIRAAIARDDLTPSLFSRCQASVFDLLQSVSFAPFLQSVHFQNAMLKLSIIGGTYDSEAQKYGEAQQGETAAGRNAAAGRDADPSRDMFQRQRSAGFSRSATRPGEFTSAGSVASPNVSAVDSQGSPSGIASIREGDEAGGSSLAPPSSGLLGSVADQQAAVEEMESGSTLTRNHRANSVAVAGSTAPTSAPVTSGSQTSYGVAPASVRSTAFGTATHTQRVHSSDAVAAAAAAEGSGGSVPRSHGPASPLSSAEMSPAALAAYLESIAEQEAAKRSASIAVQSGAEGTASNSATSLHPALNASASPVSSAGSGGAGGGGDSDSSESEAEPEEEESIFGAPVPKTSVDLGTFSPSSPSSRTRSRSGQPGAVGADSAAPALRSSPHSSRFGSEVVTEDADEAHDFFTHSRGRSSGAFLQRSSVSTTSSSSVSVTAVAVDGSGVTGQSFSSTMSTTTTRVLPAIREAAAAGDKSLTPASSDDGPAERHSRMSLAESLAAHRASVSSASGGAVAASSSPPMHATPATVSGAAAPSSGGQSAAPLSASKFSWKKSRSIFDEGDEEDGDARVLGSSLRSSPMAAAASPLLSATKPAAAAPASSSSVVPADLSVAGGADPLALLQKESVDLADLNLNEIDEREPRARADTDMF